MVQFKADQDYLSSKMSMMNKFREDSSFCDIKLMIGNQTLQAHRCVLAAGSVYFNSLFLGQFTEANMKEINLSEVTNNITALKHVLNFIYTVEIDINEDNLGVIIKLSSFLLIDSLRDFCCTFMTANFSLDTCLVYYVLSLEHGLFEIEKKCCSLMTDDLSLATCLRYYLLSLEDGLVAIDKMAGPMVQSRFHDYLIYEDATLDVSTDEMELLVERNVLQHCSNVSIFRFIARWVIKWPTKRPVLITKSISDDLIQREHAPKICPLQLEYKHSEDGLYEMFESSLIDGGMTVHAPDMFHLLYDDIIHIELGEHKVLINGLNTLKTCDLKYRPYQDFVWNKASPCSSDGNEDLCVRICLVAGKDNQQYLISKTEWLGPVQDRGIVYVLGTFFKVYKLDEDENTWQELFETEVFNPPTENCEQDYRMDMSANISSVSNEMMVVSTGEELNIVFVVDLNKENASPVTLLSSPMLHNDMDIGKRIRIVDTDDAMYIVTDGITDVRSRSGKARVRYEYKHHSNHLTDINSTVAILSHLNETSRPPKTILPPWEFDMYPCPSESSVSIGDGLWYMEGNNDIACFLTKVSVDSNKNPVLEHHTPPPFPSFTGMFASKISSKILENKKPITRFMGKE